MNGDETHSPRRARRFYRDSLILTAILVTAVVVTLVLLEIPIAHQYSATLLQGESQLNIPANSRVSISWVSNGPFCMTSNCGYVAVGILAGPVENQSATLNQPDLLPKGAFSFSAGSGPYFIWIIRGPASGMNYTVESSASLI